MPEGVGLRVAAILGKMRIQTELHFVNFVNKTSDANKTRVNTSCVKTTRVNTTSVKKQLKQ